MFYDYKGNTYHLNIQKDLSDHKSSQCHIVMNSITDPAIILFVSYTTVVIEAVKEEGVWHMKMNGKYSQTTSKQVTWFLREYFPYVSRMELEDTIGTDKWLEY